MIYLLLPAYNEEKSLPRLLPKIQTMMDENHFDYKVVIVNDGSIDNTLEIAEKYQKSMPIIIITHKYNRGLGETIRDGIEYTGERCNDDDIIIRMDCDDTHEPQYIPSMVKKIEEGNHVVVASRFEPGGGQEGLDFFRKYISLGANLFMKIFFPIKGLKEYSCGYRAYSGYTIKYALKTFGNSFIQLKGLGFSCTLEKLVKLKILGARFAEIPFTLKYHQKLSDSKMIGSVTTFGYMVLAVMYHWPWRGWRNQYKHIQKLTD